MRQIVFFILIIFTVLSISGCEEDYQTSHPEDGGILLSLDWSDTDIENTPDCQVRVIYATGEVADFNLPSSIETPIVVKPGDATLYVYSRSENINVTEGIATVRNSDNGSIIDAGKFYYYSQAIHTEKDSDTPIRATMKKITKSLKTTFAILPAEINSSISNINMVLENVYSNFDMKDGTMTATSELSTTLQTGSYYTTSEASVLGFRQQNGQKVQLTVLLKDGRTLKAESDVSTLLSDFNNVQDRPCSLSAILNISGSNISLSGWEKNATLRYLSLPVSELTYTSTAQDTIVTVTTDQPSWVFSVSQEGDWLKVSKSENKLTIAAVANNENVERKATITVSAAGLSREIKVTQKGQPVATVYKDKEVYKIQSATVGKGVNLVFMGDGYTAKDMTPGTGKYERDIRYSLDLFFSVYPYNKYREYFNAFMVIAVSNEEGLSVKSPATKVNTKFKCLWDGGNSTLIDYDAEMVFDYLLLCEDYVESHVGLNDISIIVPINADVWAGTAHLYTVNDNTTIINSQGYAVGLCPMGSAVEQILVHEVCGHVFPKLLDEYVYYTNQSYPEEEKVSINRAKQYGWFENVDFYSNILQTTWKGFANKTKYSMVGCFEGADEYGKGIWRPEANSCLNNNIWYFNAPSRWAIVRRIKYLAGETYTFEQFLNDDIIPNVPSSTRSTLLDKLLPPLAPPVINLNSNLHKKIK